MLCIFTIDRIYILLTCIVFTKLGSAEDQTFVAEFQPDIVGPSEATNEVWIEFSNHIPASKQFTACHWIKTKFYNLKYAGCLWSYCTKETYNQRKELCIQMCLQDDTASLGRYIWIRGRLQLKKGFKKESAALVKSFLHRTWSHICWTFSVETGLSKFYFNGNLLKQELFNVTGVDLALKDSEKMSDYAFIFGQEPDALRGGFEVEEAFLGDAANFNLWSYELSDSDIEVMARCDCCVLRGDIIDWDKTSLINRNVNFIDFINATSFCKSYNHFVIFPTMMRYTEAKETCEVHGGHLAVPKSDEENQMIIDIVHKHSMNCIKNNQTDTNVLWIGARKVNGKWYELRDGTVDNGIKLNYTFNYGSSTLDTDCSFVSKDGSWIAGTYACTLLSLCFICQIPNHPLYTIKGTCGISDIDWSYYLATDANNQIKFYEGYRKTNLIFDGGNWKLVSKIADLPNFDITNVEFSEHPIGRQSWNINDPQCGVYNKTQALTLSRCKFPEEFSCDSGHCISIYQRCNENRDCNDGSDETSCPLLSIPLTYNKAAAPEPRARNNTLNLYVETVIESIDGIDTGNMIVSLTTKTRITWYDGRIRVFNPTIGKANIVPRELVDQMWTPLIDLEHENAILGEIIYDKADIAIFQAYVPEKSDASKPVENRIFDGSLNAFEISPRMKIRYNCLFDIKNFPFDDNQCNFTMKIPKRKNRDLRFVEAAAILYNGSTISHQFRIGNITQFTLDTNESTLYRFCVPLSRVYTSQLTNTFVPIFIIWLFVYLTVFIELSNGSERAIGSGTAILVVTAVINSILQGLPESPYIKFVDIWIIWHFVSIFFMIICNFIVHRVKYSLKFVVIVAFPVSNLLFYAIYIYVTMSYENNIYFL